MKHQALVSSKDKSKKKCCLRGSLRVKRRSHSERTSSSSQATEIHVSFGGTGGKEKNRAYDACQWNDWSGTG